MCKSVGYSIGTILRTIEFTEPYRIRRSEEVLCNVRKGTTTRLKEAIKNE